jgi:hypothetical protein
MAGNDQQFATSVQHLLKNTGKDVNISSLPIGQNPEVAAMASKAIRPKEENRTGLINGGFENTLGAIYPGADQISKQITSRIEDAENAFRLFPDLELAAQILISSILSPKDMLKSELNFRFEDSPFSPAMSAKLLDIIRTEITQTYKLEDKLYDMLRDALFRGGSHPVLILPEAAVDQIINQTDVITTETIRNSELFKDKEFKVASHLGLLGDPRNTDTKPTLVLENMTSSYLKLQSPNYNEDLYVDPSKLKDDEFIEVKALAELASKHTKITDNFNLLKLPEIFEKGRSQRILAMTGNKLYAAALETAGTHKITASRLYDMLYKAAPSKYKPYGTVPTSANLKRRSVGRPLVLHLSSAAVVPVYVPGDPSNHIGAFIMIDGDGNPVSADSTINDFGQSFASLASGDRSGAATSSLLTEKATANLISDNYLPIIDRMSEIYSEILEKDMLERLAKGIHRNNEISISRNTEIARVMLARAWKGRYTRLVYVPGEYLTYFAFNHHRNGTGRSYLDDLSNIISMRGMALFSRIWAKVRSSISAVKVNVTFDQRDVDPVKTLESVKHLVAKSRQQYFPNDLRNVQDFTSWIQKAGIMLTWDNHPRLPNTKIDAETATIDHVEPDGELDEMLKNMTYMYFGLSPETVDAAAKADFATTVQQNSILLARRIAMLSAKAAVHLTSMVQKIAFNDDVIQQKIVEVLNAYSEEFIADLSEEDRQEFESNAVRFTQAIVIDILNRVTVSLPDSETTATVNLKTEVESYEQLIDKVLEYIISSEVLPAEIGGEHNGKMDMLKGVWKAQLMREFMANNNIAPEAFKIASVDETGKPMINLNEIIKSHSSNLMLAVTDLMKRMVKIKKAGDLDLAALDNGEGGESSSSSDDSSSSSGGDDENRLSGDDNADPFAEGGDNLDGDLTGEESTEQPGEEPTEAPTEEPEEEPTEAPTEAPEA